MNTENSWVIRVEISNGHYVVYDGGSCSPGCSTEGPVDTHFLAPSACPDLGLCLCHASVAVHAGPPSNPGLLPNLGLLPTHDLHVHDGPGTCNPCLCGFLLHDSSSPRRWVGGQVVGSGTAGIHGPLR